LKSIYIICAIILQLLLQNSSALAATSENTYVYRYVFRVCKREFKPAKAREKAAYYTPLIISVARAHHLSPLVVASVIWHESNFYPFEISYCGARGLMQVMPIHFRRGEHWNNPRTNLNVGCKVLASYLHRFGYNYHEALTAYCYGPHWVTHRGIYRSRYSTSVLRDCRR